MKHRPYHHQSIELARGGHGEHPTGVALIDRELRFVEIDGPLAAIPGWPTQDQIGRTFAEACAVIAPVVEPLLRQVLATGEPLRDTELRAELASGRGGRWLVSYEPVRARSGTVLAVECFVRELDPAAPRGVLATAQAAADSEQLFQLITDACPDLIYIYDKVANRNVYANREVATILGYSAAEVQAMGPAFIPSTIHPDDLPGVMAFADRVAASGPGEVLEHEYRMRHADGSYRWLLGREVVLTRGPDGAVGLTLGIAQDITARKRAEAAVRAAMREAQEERALLDTLIGSAPIGFDFVDRDLRFVRINEVLAANNGLPVAAHLGRTVREVLPQLADTVEPLLRQVIATGEPIIDLEISGETPAQPGVRRIWRESLYPVRGPDGEVLGVGAVVAEITEHRRSSEERTQLLVQAAAAAARTASLQAITAALAPALTPEQVARVIVEEAVRALGARSGLLALLDPSGETLEVSYHVGYEAARFFGRRWPIDTPEPLPDAVRGGSPILVRDRAEAERLYPALGAARAATPDVAWANLPLVSEDRVQGALSLGFVEPQAFTAEDAAMLATLAQQCAQALERARLYAAERLAREEAEQAVRERDDLVALISHDLKNPLTVIQGQAQLLERRIARGEHVDLQRITRGLTAIHHAASSMASQIEELLDVALIRAGRPIRLYRQAVDLVALAARSVALAQANSDRHSLRLVSPERELLAVVDGPRVERVLGNLLSNALKYSHGGEVTVTVAREDGPGPPWALLSVADQGVGIPAEDQPRIFEGFHRASNIAGTVKGTGLGLTSAMRIVEQHGGSIVLHSVEGEGSVFTVRLPLE